MTFLSREVNTAMQSGKTAVVSPDMIDNIMNVMEPTQIGHGVVVCVTPFVRTTAEASSLCYSTGANESSNDIDSVVPVCHKLGIPMVALRRCGRTRRQARSISPWRPDARIGMEHALHAL